VHSRNPLSKIKLAGFSSPACCPLVLPLFASLCIKYYIYILIALFLYMARAWAFVEIDSHLGTCQGRQVAFHQNVALPSLVSVVASWHWLLSPVLSRVRHLACCKWRARWAEPVRVIHAPRGAKRVFPRVTTLATPGLSMHPAGEHPFGLLRLERVSASADLSQVDISSGSAKIRLWFLTRHYHPFQEPTGARPAQQRKDYLAAHSMVEAPCDTAGRGCDDPAMCRTTVDQPRAVHWLVG